MRPWALLFTATLCARLCAAHFYDLGGREAPGGCRCRGDFGAVYIGKDELPPMPITVVLREGAVVASEPPAAEAPESHAEVEAPSYGGGALPRWRPIFDSESDE